MSGEADRVAVLLALAALSGEGAREAVTAVGMAAAEGGGADRWLTVLAGMARKTPTGACLLYPVALDPVDPTRTEYAAGPAGWEALRRLTAGQQVAA